MVSLPVGSCIPRVPCIVGGVEAGALVVFVVPSVLGVLFPRGGRRPFVQTVTYRSPVFDPASRYWSVVLFGLAFFFSLVWFNKRDR